MQRPRLAAVVGSLVVLLASPVTAQDQSPQKPPAKTAPAKPAPAPAAPAQPAAPPSPPAEAPAPKKISDAQGWTAYTAPEKSGQICYLVGQPSKSEPAGAKRNPIHLLVTHNTADKTSNVVSFIAGYAFKDGSDADLDVGGKKFTLFTKDDTAWARDAATDKAIVEALQKGKQAVIKGSSARGTATADTYTLAGFAPTLGEIDKACKIKR
jgi:hypothetical protein